MAEKGRPKGSPNVKAIAEAVPSRCAVCNSTEATKLGDRNIQEFEGIDSDGKPFNQIVRQRVQCDSCGQVRIDNSREFVPAGDK